MGPTSVVIVGLGSRGLSVLERIVTLAKLAGPEAGTVLVEVVDPACDGAGVHTTDQPDYLLLNTTCAQVSMFPDELSVGSDVDDEGPNLFEWVTNRGLRIGEDGFTLGAVGRPVRPTDFLPRRTLGEYLGWFLERVLARAPRHVQVRLHRAEALDMAMDGHEVAVALSDGTRLHASYAFLTTGYTPNTASIRAGRIIADPYDLTRLAEIPAGQTVAVGGFGLSAMDLMSCLTVGRGGRFVREAGEFRYLPSGAEPTLLFYSRSGVPCRTRPLVTRFEPKYTPLVLTHANIDAARVARGGPLDFDEDITPLILTEIRIAYRRCEARCVGGDAEQVLLGKLAAIAGPTDVEAVLDELDAQLGVFDALVTLDGSAGMLLDDAAAYQKWLAEVMRRDLAEGVLGFAGSPVKAALDILRDLRDTIRYTVDFGGLTPASLDRFTRVTVPLMNRAVVGPQHERHSELLALMEAGVAHVPFGPSPRVTWDEAANRWVITSTQLALEQSWQTDWLISAHIAPPAVESSASPLVRALHRRGLIRGHRPGSADVPGVDVDRDQHPIDTHGRPVPWMWVLGPLREGATFYNNLVPSPQVYSRPIVDAHRCVAAMFADARGAADAPAAG